MSKDKDELNPKPFDKEQWEAQTRERPPMRLVDLGQMPLNRGTGDLSEVRDQPDAEHVRHAPSIPDGPVGYWRTSLYVSGALTALGDVADMSTGYNGPRSGFVHETYIPGFLTPPDVVVWGNRIFQQAYEDYHNRELRYTEVMYWVVPVELLDLANSQEGDNDGKE